MKIVTGITASPIRVFAWIACDDDAVDGADDAYNVLGHGPTKEAAIADLFEQLEMERPA
jgi:hypothetical protein